jgi:hypothetical protein
MIKRLVAICIFLTIAGCAAVPLKEASLPGVKKAPPQKKSAVTKSASVARRKTATVVTQLQRQDDETWYELYDDTPIEILPDEILIVGRIKLSPDLQPEEQEFQPGKLEGMQGKAVMVRSIIKEPLPPEDTLAATDTFKVALDQDFLLTLPHSAVALLGGYTYISGERGLVSTIQLPGSWQLGIREDDHAIYIGTIHYVRSEYDTILDYIVEDDYPQAYEAYQHRLEEGIILRKELVEYRRD